MESGIDGTGRGIGLHRAHSLSTLKGNTQRTSQNVPRIFAAVMQGYRHESGITQYSRGRKVPNPSLHPFLTGEPCPVYGWKVLDHGVTRAFDAPHTDKMRYKPYVAIHERRLTGIAPLPAPTSPPPKESSKPLLKRLFFWK
jgi:hypothetical protein